MRGSDLITALKKRFSVVTDTDLARAIGGTNALITILKGQRKLSPLRVSNLVRRAQAAIADTWVTDLVEFHPIHKTKARKHWEILDQNSDRYDGVIGRLRDAVGIYFFYDSAGRVIYVGQTRRRKLWDEMKTAFNRTNVSNVIRRVRHPLRRNRNGANERRRRITTHSVPIHETAQYFSAYRMHPDYIDSVEALFTRAIPNNLINVRIEAQTE